MGTASSHQISTFSSPVNGTTPIDANTVRGNDNTIKTAYNAHDADTTVHLQNGLVASRPAASTAGQTWLASDTGAVYAYLDTGSAWVEWNYLRNTGGTVTGSLTVTGATTLQSTLAVTGAITASSTINGQTVSSAANLTGTLTVASDITQSAGTAALKAVTATSLAVSGNALPSADNTQSLGTAATRWNDLHATNGAIGTAVATNATAGFGYMGTMSGTPSGTPTTIAGCVPYVFDTAATKLWIYNGTAWKSVALA